MQLVIDIHKKDYQSILNSGQVPYGVVCAIMNGTQLPKGHGRLIDADALKTELEKLRDGWNYYGGEYESAMYQAYDISVDTVDEQPTVQPQRKKGKWIEVLEHRDEFGSTWHYECSECGGMSYKGFEPLERYCPNCGAEMGGGEDEYNSRN